MIILVLFVLYYRLLMLKVKFMTASALRGAVAPQNSSVSMRAFDPNEKQEHNAKDFKRV